MASFDFLPFWYDYDMQTVLPRRLRPGDRVRLVSPASPPTRTGVEMASRVLGDAGLIVEYGKHIFDEYGYLAGTDEARLDDFNTALRDPGLSAIIATRGGKGAYRIANGLDFEAARQYPKLLVGFSEITYLHLALLKHCSLAGVHGAPWDAATFGVASAASFIASVTSTEPIVVHATDKEPTHALTSTGKATGCLIGGNQDAVATSCGWALPDLDSAILLIEAVGLQLGHIDRQLTMLLNAGVLRRVRGVAIGQYSDCGTTDSWTAIDVLRDRLRTLHVPILGGLPIGHGKNPVAVPIGTTAELDTDAGELRITAAVR